MSFPDVETSIETLFEPTRIWLFGKPFPTIKFDRGSMSGVGNVVGAGPNATHANEFTRYNMSAAPPQPDDSPMPPKRIERMLRSGEKSFARIYSFSFEGHYYKLPRPLLFLVSGKGNKVDKYPANGRIGFETKFAGVDSRDWQFSEDILVWGVDRKDLTVCLDVEIGNYQEILLSPTASRGGSGSRGDMVGRGDMVSRGDMVGRGAGAFRGDMIGPHQNG